MYYPKIPDLEPTNLPFVNSTIDVPFFQLLTKTTTCKFTHLTSTKATPLFSNASSRLSSEITRGRIDKTHKCASGFILKKNQIKKLYTIN